MKFAIGTRFPKYFQEVHPWSVSILGLDISWDSLSEMRQVGVGVEVEFMGSGFEPERKLLSPGCASYLPYGLRQVISSPRSLGFLFCKTQMVILRGKR